MRDQTVISIIVPVYNTPEKEFDKLLSSIVKQYNSNIEILIVDDGSDCEYSEIINHYGNNINIKYYKKNHTGVSETRNYGIKLADGEYLMFVDSDDILPQNTIQSALDYLNMYSKPDAIFGRMQYCPEKDVGEQNTGKPQIYEKEYLYELKKCLLNIVPREESFKILGTQCAKLFRKEIAATIGFSKNVRLAEDQLFNLYFISKANRILVVPDIWYIYMQNSFSVSHTSVVTDYWGMIRMFWDELIHYKACESMEFRREMVDYFLSEYYSVPKRISKRKKCYLSKRRTLVEAANHPLITQAVAEYEFSLKKGFIKNLKYLLIKFRLYLCIYLIGILLSRKN